MAVDQDGRFSSKRRRSLKPKQTQPTQHHGDDIPFVEFEPASLRVRLTLRHLKWLARGAQKCGLGMRWLALGTGRLALSALRNAKALFVGSMAAFGMACLLLGVVVWAEPETFAVLLHPSLAQGGLAQDISCLPQSRAPDLSVWP